MSQTYSLDDAVREARELLAEAEAALRRSRRIPAPDPDDTSISYAEGHRRERECAELRAAALETYKRNIARAIVLMCRPVARDIMDVLPSYNDGVSGSRIYNELWASLSDEERRAWSQTHS
jgi:hypothetical protein